MIKTSIRYLENSAQRWPNKVAIADKDTSFTYAELRCAALRVATALRGIGKNQPVAVCLQKSCNSIVSFLGTMYSGNFYTPLDAKSPKDRLEKILSNLEPVAIIMDAHAKAMLQGSPALRNTQIVEIEAVPSFAPDEAAPARFEAGVIDTDPMYCIYTSGSTGVPKGVLISHRSLVDYIEFASEAFQLGEETVFGNQAQFHFDISTLDIFGAMKAGGAMHIIPEQLFTFPPKLMQFLAERKINSLYWVPSAMNQLAATDALSLMKEKSLRKILFAGEVMPVKTLNYWKSHFPDALFANLYGPTEITVTCTHYIVNREFSTDESLPIGNASNNTDILVLDDQNKLVPPTNTSAIGELCVRGTSLALGYWKDFEKTAAVFVQNPLNDSYPEKIYRTGDFVNYNSRGEIEYRGRRDQMIKHLGYRIEIGEIERAILSIPGVNNACVVYDEERKRIACVFEAKDIEIDDGHFRTLLAAVLPKYMVPTSYLKVSTIPIGSTGKIDRLIIRELYQNHVIAKD